jgi:hypothetical protein
MPPKLLSGKRKLGTGEPRSRAGVGRAARARIDYARALLARQGREESELRSLLMNTARSTSLLKSHSKRAVFDSALGIPVGRPCSHRLAGVASRGDYQSAVGGSACLEREPQTVSLVRCCSGPAGDEQEPEAAEEATTGNCAGRLQR